jgi:hypothetical protein
MVMAARPDSARSPFAALKIACSARSLRGLPLFLEGGIGVISTAFQFRDFQNETFRP